MAKIKFDVINRWSGKVQFTADIDCDENASSSVKLGLAVRWAVKARADLADANLADAYLADANLAYANLARANLTGAYLARANLADADLTGAYLTGAYLARANLADANLVDGGQRSDGFRFIGWVKSGELMIRAGCRNLTISEAREHWQETRGGTALGAETMAILDHIEAVAKVRGLLGASQAEAA